MKSRINRGMLASIVVFLVLLIDQIIKIAVKTNMRIGDDIVITDWFLIRFIENNGMAWGMELGSKLFLSVFRIIAVALIIYYIVKLVKAKAARGYIVLISMICAGAFGNIVDSLLYGQIFTESTPWSVATLTEFGHGYAAPLMGKVVDMFYFPIIDTMLPEWVPFWGGEHFIFFSPIFNFADASISVGVILILIFFRKELSKIED
ncbi:MAG: lipoprotein signal peptidase [Prevotella sp.]|nr:lipoprotein signal peptidase [Prevotella sp.]